MKKILCSIIVLLCCQFVVWADDCSDALSEAKSLYNSGNYAKAKSLFEYVKSECGSSYGDATNWIAKCNDALTPKLSLSRTSISVGASSGSTSITVTSNRTWELRNTSSSMFSVSKSGNTITIQNYSNSSTSSRNDYFDVATTDGSKSVRVYVYQNGKTASSSLSVSKTSISTGASGITEYITVSCNTTWEIQHPTGTMYSVTRSGNTLTVKINANSSTESRSDYFSVKTTDGSNVQKITLSQTGKSSYQSSSNNSTPTQYQISRMSARFTSAYIEHNVMNNGEKCMKIHSHLSINNMKGYQAYVIAWIYNNNGNSQTSYRTESKYKRNINDSHHLLAWETVTPRYDSSEWKDFTLYFPNTLLSTSGYVQLEIREYTSGKTIALSEKLSFTCSNK